ncbi:Protein lunapark [Cyberlindnera fabianii]|uniref:Endoplasmic reticulum junction formation protein lunapark n=1 Tax=Cyberlindnera fabianii TaxID=36022 RepID=A0A1V2L4B6_CYBFA|nr:Protein lunapark [Cyberlindnera fabianii]
MAWLSFLKSKDFDPAQFERELAELARRITAKERNVSKYTYQAKQLRRIVLVYGVLIYFAHITLLALTTHMTYTNVSPIQWAGVAGGPILIVLFMKAIASFYNMRIERTQTSAQQLKEEHSEKIEELKEKTKFSSTQALLNRFADGGDLNAKVDEELAEKQRQLDEIKKMSLEQERAAKEFSAYPQQGYKRSWIDTIVDGVVGSDELSPNNRFALICQHCLAHNGLAPPGQTPDAIKYRCPSCGFLNGVSVDGTPTSATLSSDVTDTKTTKTTTDDEELTTN